MHIQEITNLERKEIPLSYRRLYSGEAIIAFADDRETTCPIEFALEHSPTGRVDIRVEVKGAIDYPIVPIIRKLKDHIARLDRARSLD
jgi:hypothetical protein